MNEPKPRFAFLPIMLLIVGFGICAWQVFVHESKRNATLKQVRSASVVLSGEIVELRGPIPGHACKDEYRFALSVKKVLRNDTTSAGIADEVSMWYPAFGRPFEFKVGDKVIVALSRYRNPDGENQKPYGRATAVYEDTKSLRRKLE